MSAKPKLTPEQVQQLRERNFLYMRLRLEAAKHSVIQLAKEFGVCRATVNEYLNKRA